MMASEHEHEDRSRPTTRSVEQTVEIDVAPERVWRALTVAEELERWFPLEARVVSGAGGAVWMSWGNEYQGEARIVDWDPPRHLRTTWGAPEGGEPAQMTDYLVEGRGGGTVLRVVTSGFPLDAAWDDWVEGTRLGWQYELSSLKIYLEQHDGSRRRVVYVRRRVQLPRDRAWGRLMARGGLQLPPTEGAPLGVEPPRQWTAVLADPPRSLLRVSTEPCMPGVDGVDVTLFLAAWGEGHDALLATLETEWRAELARLYPEGIDPDGGARGSREL